MAMWDDVLPRLGGRWRWLCYDHRGHGESSAEAGPYDMADLAGDFVELMDALAIDRVHFVGLSLGGMVGLQLASAQPTRLLSLTVCDAGNTLTPAARGRLGAAAAGRRRGGNRLDCGGDLSPLVHTPHSSTAGRPKCRRCGRC